MAKPVSFEGTITVNFTSRELMMDNAIIRDPNILGGVPVFRHTRVPFQALLDYLEGGRTLDDFLNDFPTVTRDAAVAAMEQAKSALTAHLQ